jgi:hypothetical protein
MPVPTEKDKKATFSRPPGKSCPKGYKFDRKKKKCVFNSKSTYWRQQSVSNILSNTFTIDPNVDIKKFGDLLKWRGDDESKSSASSYLQTAAVVVGILGIVLGTIFVGNLFMGAVSFAVTWAIPASIATLGLVTLGTLYVFGSKYYKHKQQKKLDIDQWQLFACKIQTIIGEGDQIRLLRNLKVEIEEWSETQEAGITEQTIKDLIKKINVVITCERKDDCSDKLGEIVEFLIEKITVGIEKQEDVPDVVDIPKRCNMPEYIVTLNEDEGKIDVNKVRYGGQENFSVPKVRMEDVPSGTQQLKERVMKGAFVEIQSCVVNEITAIHDAQRRFLDELIHEPGSWWRGRNLILIEEFADIEQNLKGVQTLDDFNLFSEFMCQFSKHKGRIKERYNGGQDEKYTNAETRLNQGIKQIIAIRELQVETILDLYGSYIYNIGNLTKLDYWNKTLSLFEDQGVGYKGLFKKAITFTGHIDGSINSIKKLKDKLDTAIEKEKQPSSVKNFSYFYYGPGQPVSSQPKLKF